MNKGCLGQNAFLLSPMAQSDNRQKCFMFLQLSVSSGRPEKPYTARVLKIPYAILTNNGRVFNNYSFNFLLFSQLYSIFLTCSEKVPNRKARLIVKGEKSFFSFFSCCPSQPIFPFVTLKQAKTIQNF